MTHESSPATAIVPAVAGRPTRAPAEPAGPAGHPAAGPAARPRRRRPRDRATTWMALLWVGPAVLLILAVVVYPAVELVRAAASDYSITGLRRGSAGFDNVTAVLTHPALPTVLWNTAVWVVAVVSLTILCSLPLAQFIAKEFVGRRLVRWAIIVPWAASLVITSRLFTLIYDYYYGVLNSVLLRLHLVGAPVDFLGDARWVMPSMIVVGVFVSVPFTTYVLLSGLNAIPADVYEAARIDGAGVWQAYWHVTLPLLRPALLTATVLNLIYVFNSFALIYTLTDRTPGFGEDTTITFAYKLAFKSAERDIGMSAAAGLFNVLLIAVVVAGYLRVARPRTGASG